MTYKALPKPPATNKQVQEYLSAAQKGNESIFVVSTDSGWGIRKATDKNFKGTFPTKSEASSEANKLAKNDSEIFFFDKDGKLISK